MMYEGCGGASAEDVLSSAWLSCFIVASYTGPWNAKSDFLVRPYTTVIFQQYSNRFRLVFSCPCIQPCCDAVSTSRRVVRVHAEDDKQKGVFPGFNQV